VAPEDLLRGDGQEAGLEGARAASTPGTSELKPSTAEEKAIWEDPLDDEWSWLYRRLVGKLRWSVEERPDVIFATQRLSRDLAVPTWSSWLRLRRTVRYLIGTTNHRLLVRHPGTEQELEICAWTDSDYATDVTTRRSVGCVLLFAGPALIHAHARQQTVVATSSAEAEYYSLGSGAIECLGVLSLLTEAGVPCSGQLRCDSSSGRALALREGFGRMKHVDVKMLWLQQVLSSGRLTLKATKGTENPADIGTKYLDAFRLSMLSEKIGLFSPGEAEINMLEASRLLQLRWEAAAKLRTRVDAWRALGDGCRAWWQWHLEQADDQEELAAWCEAQAQKVERTILQMRSYQVPPDSEEVSLLQEVCQVDIRGGAPATMEQIEEEAEFEIPIELWFWRTSAVLLCTLQLVKCSVGSLSRGHQKQRAESSRDVSVQSMTTYTWLRGVEKPRFQVLPEIAAGVTRE